ncbi:MAG: hypothetical protein JXR95_13065 [Deltaproteobacteria bacterium]|nr:hypothetical protein [Deltaproteobacteria bacterium]
MKYMCTSCSNIFDEPSEGDLRCPECLRKKGLIVWDGPEKPGFNKRKLIFFGILFIIAAASIAAFFIIKKKSPSRRESNSIIFNVDINNINQATGYNFNEKDNPFHCGENCQKLSSRIHKTEDVFRLIKANSTERYSSEIKGNLATAEELSEKINKNKNKISATSLEWSILAGVLIKKSLNIPFEIIEFEKSSGKYTSNSICNGNFAVKIQGEKEESELKDLLALHSNISGEKIISPKQVFARFHALKGIRIRSRVNNEWEFLYPPSMVSGRITDSENDKTLKLLVSLEKLDSSSPMIQGCMLWFGLEAKMPSLIRKYSRLLESNSNSLATRAMILTAALATGNMTRKFKTSEFENNRLLPLAVLYKAYTGENIQKNFLQTIVSSKDSGGIYAVILYHMTRRKKEHYARVIELIDKYFPKPLRWNTEMLFTASLELSNFARCREIIAFIKKEQPNSTLAKHYEHMLNTKIKSSSTESIKNTENNKKI